MSKNETNEIATKNSNICTTFGFSNDRPDYADPRFGRGSENVDVEDIMVPRIEVVQSLSKCRKKTDPSYIEGAQEGHLYNSLTLENYGDQVIVIPVAFGKEYLLWRDQKKGGGFGGSYPTEEEANAALSLREKPEEWEINLTHNQFVMICKPDGTLEEAVISMSKSKLKVSRNLNSQIRMVGGDRWARAFFVAGAAVQNDQGQDFYNLRFTAAGWTPKELYAKAEAMYKSVMSGVTRADVSTMEEASTGVSEDSEY